MSIDSKMNLPEGYRAAHNAIDAKVAEACKLSGHKKVYVQYAAYETDNEVPIDNLDDVAIEGNVILTYGKDPFCRGTYRSMLLHSPTWLQVCVCYNKAIVKTGDESHPYMEGLKTWQWDGTDESYLGDKVRYRIMEIVSGS